MSMKPDFTAPTLYGLELANAFHMLSANEYFLLRAVAAALPKDPTVVNIGAGTGTSSLAVAETRHDAAMVTVDISEGGPFGGLENERNAYSKNNFSPHLPMQILSDSQEYGRQWGKDSDIDLLIIDADHSESGCRGDFEAWYGNVKDGGYILFHDYDRDVWPDVKVVVDDLTGIDHIITVDTLYVAKKNKFLRVRSDEQVARPRRNKKQV